MRDYLEEIVFHLPATFRPLLPILGTLVGHRLKRTADRYLAVPSAESYLPRISLDSSSSEAFARADFVMSGHEISTVYVKNVTGRERPDPVPFRHIELEEVRRRFTSDGVEILGIDHLGFNLPWFGNNLHPSMLDLRSRLKAGCLYHRFPTGEPWDFIIPGEKREIAGRRAVDYSAVRTPKFEMVSFRKASTPLVQIDLTTSIGYERIIQLFPDALDDPSARTAWIYIRNDSAIDLCLVANELRKGDWSSFFRGHRIR